MTRKEFLGGFSAIAATTLMGADPVKSKDELDQWQAENDLVSREVYLDYLNDGNTRGLKGLERLEQAFDKVLSEVKSVKVESTPAVWHLYNMGFVVKTKEALFSIDLRHRREVEFAKLLDFALVTHNHEDHFQYPFYAAMDGAGKTVISNFMDNYGARKFKNVGGYARGAKTFKIKDVEIRTGLTDHNKYLINFTSTFEIKVGDWKLFHTGDCCNSKKLKAIWGSPDLWFVMPGCGIDIADAYDRLQPKKVVFGHLMELSHPKDQHRMPVNQARRASAKVKAKGGAFHIPIWGERLV